MARKILIDTDPGVDDTMAILFALHSPEFEIVGLSAVFGNTRVETTAQNALRLVELEGHDQIPVAQGLGRPMVMPLRGLGTHVHGEDGMGGTNPPPPQGKLVKQSAPEFIVETILANPGEITLVPIGPLSNVGMALRLEPRIASLVKEVVIMGGSVYARGNATPVGEANIANDPQAAEIVFSAGWPLTMVGLDVTKKTQMTPQFLQTIFERHSKATDLIERILPFYQRYFDQWFGLAGTIHTHDPSAIAYLLDPSLYRTEKMPVFIETLGRCAGETVPDPRKMWIQGPDVNVCLEVDADRVLKLFHERITA
jgi:uridine nucleosidase